MRVKTFTSGSVDFSLTFFNLIYELVVQCVGFVVIGNAVLSAYTGKILVGNVLSYIRSVGLV